jgi:two-component system, chemotaxis family, protein-glutamate methylesterase/glutaminase
MTKVSVLVVDDSVVVRRILREALASDLSIELVGAAANGQIALAMMAQKSPDLVTLDIEMPQMDGLETLRELRKLYPRLPVIMFSTLTERGATITLDALAAGANDYVTKPSGLGSPEESIARVREQLLPKIKALCGLKPPVGASATPKIAHVRPRSIFSGPRRIDVVAIGTSTGGPNALGMVLPSIPAGFPVPIVIVQHMPPIFTRFLAERLSASSRIRVSEAADGKPLIPGEAVIAPGDYHLEVVRAGTRIFCRLQQGPAENSCRPSVDVLFRSVANVYGPATMAVVMTGMGQDGLAGAESINDAGGLLMAQDEATSVVWGMPGFVVKANLAEAVLPVEQIGPEIVRKVLLAHRLSIGALAAVRN